MELIRVEIVEDEGQNLVSLKRRKNDTRNFRSDVQNCTRFVNMII